MSTEHHTTALAIGQRIESLMHHRFGDGDEVLSATDRADIIEHALTFEECSNTREELQALNDCDLVNVCWWVMADYARGQE